jgi:hypothetical protein
MLKKFGLGGHYATNGCALNTPDAAESLDCLFRLYPRFPLVVYYAVDSRGRESRILKVNIAVVSTVPVASSRDTPDVAR